MTAFALKVIALAAMLIDHVGAVFPDAPFELRLIGRLTFPIFVYLIAEGFRHTKNPKGFLIRLFAFALISEVPYDWAINRAHNIGEGLSPWHIDFFGRTNVFYTLFLGGLAIYIFQTLYETHIASLTNEASPKERRDAYISLWSTAALAASGLFLLAEILGTDFGGLGVVFIFLMYVVKQKGPRLAVLALMCVLQHSWLFTNIWAGEITYLYWLFPATLATVPLIALYNGKRGYSMKWLFYWAYPVHLVILSILINSASV